MCEAFHALTVEPAANEIMPEPDSNFRQEMTEQWTLSNDQPEGHGFQAPAKGHVATSLPAALQCWISYTQAKVLTIKKDLRLLVMIPCQWGSCSKINMTSFNDNSANSGSYGSCGRTFAPAAFCSCRRRRRSSALRTSASCIWSPCTLTPTSNP